MLAGWRQPPTTLVLNKIDKIEPEIRSSALKALQRRFAECAPFERVFCTSAVRREGVGELKAHLLAKVSARKCKGTAYYQEYLSKRCCAETKSLQGRLAV